MMKNLNYEVDRFLDNGEIAGSTRNLIQVLPWNRKRYRVKPGMTQEQYDIGSSHGITKRDRTGMTQHQEEHWLRAGMTQA